MGKSVCAQEAPSTQPKYLPAAFDFGANWSAFLRAPDAQRVELAKGSIQNFLGKSFWIAGYPFEVARPDEVFEFCRSRGVKLQVLKTSGRCNAFNQFVFVNEK